MVQAETQATKNFPALSENWRISRAEYNLAILRYDKCMKKNTSIQIALIFPERFPVSGTGHYGGLSDNGIGNGNA
jgi:hypothetical protein